MIISCPQAGVAEGSSIGSLVFTERLRELAWKHSWGIFARLRRRIANSNPGFTNVAGLIRGLNAADAARILARYGYLEPESRPLLARGALRSAAILLDGQPRSKEIEQLELIYGEETSRIALERKAADYKASSEEFSGKFQMEEGESWFCARSKTL